MSNIQVLVLPEETTVEVLEDGTVQMSIVEDITSVEITEEPITVEVGIELVAPRIVASANPPVNPLIGDIWIDMSV